MKTSIQEIEKVWNTNGSRPVLVLCNDLNHYVVKYKRNNLVATALFNEYLAASFLRIWELHVPNFEFIKIQQEHVPPRLHADIQPYFFNDTCFGSKHSRSYLDVTHFLHMSSEYWKKRFILNKELLQIALFDAWMANEDRNANNPNLMYDLDQDNRFVTIDHQHIFNSSNLQYGLSQLTYTDSILNFQGIKSLFKKKELVATETIDQLEKKYYICVEECSRNLDGVVDSTPSDWNIDQNETVRLIRESIFSEEWIKDSWKSFISFVQTLVNQY